MNTNGSSLPNPYLAFFRTPKGYTLVALLALTLVAGIKPETPTWGLNVAVAMATAILVDVAFALHEDRKRIFPDGAALTGLIIALVLSPDVPWYLCAWTAGAAILSKHVLMLRKRPVFNPAAVGLLVGLVLFGTGQSWWGGLPMLPVWCTGFLVIAGMLVTNRVNKFPAVFAFLGVYFGAMLLLAGLPLVGMHAPNFAAAVSDSFRVPFTNSALFLAFFMLTDPPTSAAKYPDQVLFGAIAAVVAAADYLWLGGLTYLLVGLLAANGWNALRSR